MPKGVSVFLPSIFLRGIVHRPPNRRPPSRRPPLQQVRSLSSVAGAREKAKKGGGEVKDGRVGARGGLRGVAGQTGARWALLVGINANANQTYGLIRTAGKTST